MLDEAYDTSLKFIVEKVTDTSESVVVESLNSLQQMIEFLSMKAISPYMTSLLLKIRPCFDNSNHNVRSLGFNLFSRIIGLLLGESSINDQKINDIIKEQVHNHLISLMLHANDETVGVRNNCIKTLNKAMLAITGRDTSELYTTAKEKHGGDYAKLYEEYIIGIAEIVYSKYPNKIPYHLQNLINHSLSTQESVRGSSVLMIGIFYSLLTRNNNQEILRHVNVEQIFNNFSKLLKDFSSGVKIKTVRALTYFKDINA